MNHTYQIKKARMVMTEREALELLQRHNRWRRGDDSLEMEDPRALGHAIDVACRALAKYIDQRLMKYLIAKRDLDNS